MDKTFSWSGIKKEAKRVRWPKAKDTWSNTVETVVFTAFFALFFVGAEPRVRPSLFLLLCAHD